MQGPGLPIGINLMFGVLPKDTSAFGQEEPKDRTASPAISGQPALPPERQLLCRLHIWPLLEQCKENFLPHLVSKLRSDSCIVSHTSSTVNIISFKVILEQMTCKDGYIL